MNALIVCSSTHRGNTRKIASAMANVLHADLLDSVESIVPILQNYDLLGVGSGVYFGFFHRAIRLWLRDLPDGVGRGRKAFVFSTSGLPFLSGLYHRSTIRLLKRKGFEIEGQFACRGHDSFGPLALFGGLHAGHPNSRDLIRAGDFASHLSGP